MESTKKKREVVLFRTNKIVSCFHLLRESEEILAKSFNLTFGLSFSSLMSNKFRSFNNIDEAGSSLLNKLAKIDGTNELLKVEKLSQFKARTPINESSIPSRFLCMLVAARCYFGHVLRVHSCLWQNSTWWFQLHHINQAS